MVQLMQAPAGPKDKRLLTKKRVDNSRRSEYQRPRNEF